MQTRLEFKSPQSYLGRNGDGMASAVEITDLNTHRIVIEPVTAVRKQVARCRISIPRSPDFLRVLAATLNEMADEIEGGA